MLISVKLLPKYVIRGYVLGQFGTRKDRRVNQKRSKVDPRPG